MIVRMGKTSKKGLANCVKYGLWGSGYSLNKWHVGDMLILYVDKKLAALAKVAGEAFVDDTPLWEHGLFRFRIPVKFSYVLNGDDMIPFDPEVTNILIKEWGVYYGWGILAKRPLSKESSEKLIELITQKAGV